MELVGQGIGAEKFGCSGCGVVTVPEVFRRQLCSRPHLSPGKGGLQVPREEKTSDLQADELDK